MKKALIAVCALLAVVTVVFGALAVYNFASVPETVKLEEKAADFVLSADVVTDAPVKALSNVISKDMKEPYLSFDVEDKQVRCSVHGDGVEVVASWYYQPFIYIENEYKNPTISQQDGLRVVLAEKFEKYLKSHPSILEVLDWDLFFDDETRIKIAFKLTPNKKLRDW